MFEWAACGTEPRIQRMPTWVCRAGQGGQFASDFETKGVIAIGWMDADLSQLSHEEVIKLLRDDDPTGHMSKATVPAGILRRFVQEMKPGDTVITPDGTTRQLLVGTIEGPYEYRAKPTVADMHHYHRMAWEGRYSRDVLPQRILYSLGSVLTLFKFDSADEALRILRASSSASGGVVSLDEAEQAATEIAQSSESGAKELIAHRIAALDDNALEGLVAGLLRAMGYYTRVVGEGADGGVDVRAARDALFSEGPFLKIQVKARPTTPMRPQELRALAGVLREGDRGIFVSTGGFTPAARTEFGDRLTLIDVEELQQLYIEYYERSDEQTRALLPLKKVWFPVNLGA